MSHRIFVCSIQSDEWSIYYINIHTDEPPTILSLYGVESDRRTLGKILNVVAKYNIAILFQPSDIYASENKCVKTKRARSILLVLRLTYPRKC